MAYTPAEWNRRRSQVRNQNPKTGPAPGSEGEIVLASPSNVSNWRQKATKLQPPVGVVSSAPFLLAY